MINQHLRPYVEFGQGHPALVEKLNLIHELDERARSGDVPYEYINGLEQNSVFELRDFADYFKPGDIKFDNSPTKPSPVNGRLYLNPVFIFTRGGDIYTHCGQENNGLSRKRNSNLSITFDTPDRIYREENGVPSDSIATKNQVDRFIWDSLDVVMRRRYTLKNTKTDTVVSVPSWVLWKGLKKTSLSYVPGDQFYTNRLNIVHYIDLGDHMAIYPNQVGEARQMGWIPQIFITSMEGEGQSTGMDFFDHVHYKHLSNI